MAGHIATKKSCTTRTRCIIFLQLFLWVKFVGYLIPFFCFVCFGSLETPFRRSSPFVKLKLQLHCERVRAFMLHLWIIVGNQKQYVVVLLRLHRCIVSHQSESAEPAEPARGGSCYFNVRERHLNAIFFYYYCFVVEADRLKYLFATFYFYCLEIVALAIATIFIWFVHINSIKCRALTRISRLTMTKNS